MRLPRLQEFRAETYELHAEMCLELPLPCGMGTLACTRRLGSWIQGDVDNAAGYLMRCSTHNESPLVYCAKENKVRALVGLPVARWVCRCIQLRLCMRLPNLNSRLRPDVAFSRSSRRHGICYTQLVVAQWTRLAAWVSPRYALRAATGT